MHRLGFSIYSQSLPISNRWTTSSNHEKAQGHSGNLLLYYQLLASICPKKDTCVLQLWASLLWPQHPVCFLTNSGCCSPCPFPSLRESHSAGQVRSRVSWMGPALICIFLIRRLFRSLLSSLWPSLPASTLSPHLLRHTLDRCPCFPQW